MRTNAEQSEMRLSTDSSSSVCQHTVAFYKKERPAEGCPVGDLKTNFAGGGTQLSIGAAQGLGGPKHIIMELDNSGDVPARWCPLLSYSFRAQHFSIAAECWYLQPST